jgi:hypothetical protein
MNGITIVVYVALLPMRLTGARWLQTQIGPCSGGMEQEPCLRSSRSEMNFCATG